MISTFPRNLHPSAPVRLGSPLGLSLVRSVLSTVDLRVKLARRSRLVRVLHNKIH